MHGPPNFPLITAHEMPKLFVLKGRLPGHMRSRERPDDDRARTDTSR
jgi:hypothetical protein